MDDGTDGTDGTQGRVAPGTPIPSHYRWCVGCGADHPTGLHLEVTAGEGLCVHGRFAVGEHHQGAPGLAHGGVLATALDEVLGSLNWLLGDPVVTGRLEVSYLRPVPVGSALAIEARVEGVDGRKVRASAIGRLEDGAAAVRASAVFVRVPMGHFLEHGDPALVGQALADRARGGPSWRPDAIRGASEVNP